jgi:hypothetical protein
LIATVVRKIEPRELDASVAASGPHDFAVCGGCFVRRKRLAPSASIASRAQRSVTIAKRPSPQGHGTGEEVPVICPTAQGKGLRHFNATGKSLEVRKILSSAEQLLALSLRGRRTRPTSELLRRPYH